MHQVKSWNHLIKNGAGNIRGDYDPDKRYRLIEKGILPRTKLKRKNMTKEQVEEMKKLRAEGWTIPKLAERFGVSRKTMWRRFAIIDGKKKDWRN